MAGRTSPGLQAGADEISERPRQIEAHSIDIIPPAERHGRPANQFALWFTANAELLGFVLGGFAISFGMTLFWAIVSIVAGELLGALFTSLHAIQGPRLGVPQMIQSRAQFGFYGAGFIFLAAILLDVGYLAAQLVLQAQSMNGLIGAVSIPVWIIIAIIPSIVLAIFGYDWIHRVQPALTILFVVITIMGVVTVATSRSSHLATGMDGFHLPSAATFVAAVGLYFMNGLSWAPDVSDYTRYLPAGTSARRLFWWVFSGNAAGFILFAALGAYVTSIAPATSNITTIAGFAGRWILPLFVITLISVNTVNAYSGMLAVETFRGTFQKVRGSRAARCVGIMLIFLISAVLAETGYKTFLTSFEDFINVLLFVFVPWSVINLIDFFWIQRGHYEVASFFTARGRYGGIRWRAVIAYVVALAAQVPFLDQTLYVGPMVNILHGADISWVAGWLVGGAAYLVAWRVPGGSVDSTRSSASAWKGR
jgi:nucleobase:cation symporter-1, NCS1 family